MYILCSNQSSNNTQYIVHELQQQNALLQKAFNRIMEMADQQQGNCKEVKEQDDELRLLIKELQNNIDIKLTQTESKLKQLLSLSESVYVSYNSNHSDGSLWPLILFMANEISDQVAPAAILKMSNFAKMKKNKEIWHSNSFFAFQRGYKMRLEVSAAGSNDGEGTHVSVYLHLMKGPHDDKLEQSGHWPLRGTFTIELLNQLSDNNHHGHLIQFHHHFCSECTNRVLEGFMAKKGSGKSQFISHDILLHHNNSNYCINDSLMFRISYEDMEPPYQVAPVTFKVTHFLSQWLKHKGMWSSSYFFAFDGGYQMLLRIHAAGHEGTHVSIYLQLIKGPHDDKLKQLGQWPLKGIFKIELLNQLNDSDHYSDKMRFKKEGDMYDMYAYIYGISQFISHDVLLHHSSNGYLKEDTAYFRISYQNYQEFDWIDVKLTALYNVIVVISFYLSLYFMIMMRNHQKVDLNDIKLTISFIITVLVISFYLSTYISISYYGYNQEVLLKLYITSLLSVIEILTSFSVYYFVVYNQEYWNEILKLTTLFTAIMVLSAYFAIIYHQEFDWNEMLKLTTLLTAIVVILLSAYFRTSYQSYRQGFNWNGMTKIFIAIVVINQVLQVFMVYIVSSIELYM